MVQDAPAGVRLLHPNIEDDEIVIPVAVNIDELMCGRIDSSDERQLQGRTECMDGDGIDLASVGLGKNEIQAEAGSKKQKRFCHRISNIFFVSA